MQTPLERTLDHFSPRYRARPVPALSLFVYAAVLVLWVVSVAGAWLFNGVYAWSAGLLYVAYDTWLLVHVARKTAFIMRAEPGTPAACSARPAIAVVVAARNEVDALPATIAALLRQGDLPEEIIIVDDGSTDLSRALLRERYGLSPAIVGGPPIWSTLQPRLGLVCLPPGGKSRALNAGLAASTAAVVITVDADTLLEADAVAGIRAAFAAEPELVAACGVLTPSCASRGLGAIFLWFQTYEYIRAFVSRIAWMQSGSLLLVSGAFAAFRRDALLTVGGFDPHCLVEDYEVIHRLHRYAHEERVDWRVRVLSTARGTTEVPSTPSAFLRQRRRWFAGFLQTQYWNRDMTANRRYGNLGRVMLPIKAVDTLQPIYGLTAFGLLVLFAVTGNLRVLWPVLTVILVKVVVDLAFYLWWVRLYSRWLAEPLSARRQWLAALAALAEPFSFQLLRHTGAAWGWFSFLTGRLAWGHTTTRTPASSRQRR